MALLPLNSLQTPPPPPPPPQLLVKVINGLALSLGVVMAFVCAIVTVEIW